MVLHHLNRLAIPTDEEVKHTKQSPWRVISPNAKRFNELKTLEVNLKKKHHSIECTPKSNQQNEDVSHCKQGRKSWDVIRLKLLRQNKDHQEPQDGCITLKKTCLKKWLIFVKHLIVAVLHIMTTFLKKIKPL
jgi:hypothetical protein